MVRERATGVVGSALLHAGVIFLMATIAVPRSARLPPSRAIEVALVSPSPPEPAITHATPLPPVAEEAPVAIPALPPVRPSPARKKVEAQVSPPPASARPSASVDPSLPVAPELHDASAAPPSGEISPIWRKGVAEWLRANRRYPDDARRRNETGVVQVRFVVARDGRVIDFAILRGSGSAILDDAARAMLADARLPAFPDGMPQETTSVTVQIRFDLER
jgi:periplasmic protein TonB